MLLVNTNSKEKVEKEIEKMLSMLLNTYCESVRFPRTLGSDIFGYLQAKDSTFRELVIKRQKKYRNLQKKKAQQELQEIEKQFPKLIKTESDFERFP